jgi:23S rRNA pseudouridine2605 synthase
LRLNVYLQKAGVGSRREAERLVAEGVVQVNGIVAVATTPANEGDVVTVRGKAVASATRPLPRLFLLNKPVDVMCTHRDHKGRRTIFDLDSMKAPHLPRLMNVGRLDANSEGLMVMSSDGPLAQAMMSPGTALARVYRVRLRGRLGERDIAGLAEGISVEGVSYRGAEFVEEYGNAGRSNTWYRVVLTEGKNREIRKLMAHFGCVVNRLIRVQYGPFMLDALKTGELREVEPGRIAEFLDHLKARGAWEGSDRPPSPPPSSPHS